MFSSGMTPADAQAELLRLKLAAWPQALACLDGLVPRPTDDLPTSQGDWIDVVDYGGLVGEAGLIYCRLVLGAPGRDLIGMIGLRDDGLGLPKVGRRERWDPVSTDLDHPLITSFRHWACGKSERMELLRTHLPLRRTARYGVGGMEQHDWSYELVPRAEVVGQLYRQIPALVRGARFGFRMGGVVVHLGDAEFDARLRILPKFSERVRGQGFCVDEAEYFRNDLVTLVGIMRTHSFVPEGEGVSELRARAAGR